MIHSQHGHQSAQLFKFYLCAQMKAFKACKVNVLPIFKETFIKVTTQTKVMPTGKILHPFSAFHLHFHHLAKYCIVATCR